MNPLVSGSHWDMLKSRDKTLENTEKGREPYILRCERRGGRQLAELNGKGGEDRLDGNDSEVRSDAKVGWLRGRAL